VTRLRLALARWLLTGTPYAVAPISLIVECLFPQTFVVPPQRDAARTRHWIN